MEVNESHIHKQKLNYFFTGVTESRAKVTIMSGIVGSEESGVDFLEYEVTADDNGVFTIVGELCAEYPEYDLVATNNATVILRASDMANNISSETFVQIVRSESTTPVVEPNSPSNNGSGISSNIIWSGINRFITASLLSSAAMAAGQNGTVIINTSQNSVNLTGDGLLYLIDQGCAMQLTTGSGTMLISAEVLAGLDISSDSTIEFTLGIPETIDHHELLSLADNGYPVYEISIRVNDRAIHRLAGRIIVTLENKAFTTPDRMKVIHLLDDGIYQVVTYTLTDGVLSFTLNSLSYICMPDTKIAAELLKYPFTDISENDWFYNNVLFVYQKKLMIGTSSDSFSPELNLTRAMAVTVLHRLSGDTESFDNTFSDIASGVWYEDAVAWASANGITRGTGNGRFSPNENITREQFATMLYNYAKYKKYDVSIGEDTNILSYKDALIISEYAYPALQWTCGTGIMVGDESGMLNPQKYATRAQIAAMIQRFINSIEK